MARGRGLRAGTRTAFAHPRSPALLAALVLVALSAVARAGAQSALVEQVAASSDGRLATVSRDVVEEAVGGVVLSAPSFAARRLGPSHGDALFDGAAESMVRAGASRLVDAARRLWRDLSSSACDFARAVSTRRLGEGSTASSGAPATAAQSSDATAQGETMEATAAASALAHVQALEEEYEEEEQFYHSLGEGAAAQGAQGELAVPLGGEDVALGSLGALGGPEQAQGHEGEEKRRGDLAHASGDTRQPLRAGENIVLGASWNVLRTMVEDSQLYQPRGSMLPDSAEEAAAAATAAATDAAAAAEPQERATKAAQQQQDSTAAAVSASSAVAVVRSGGDASTVEHPKLLTTPENPVLGTSWNVLRTMVEDSQLYYNPSQPTP